MKRSILFLMLISLLSAGAQVTFVIDSLPEYTPEEDNIYIVGDFNGWNPGDVNHMLQKNNEGLWETSLDGFVDGITIEYKFTRGDWETVEKGPNGEEIVNRLFTFGNGETVEIIIYNWADAGGPGESTAAWNVSIMDENFYMPQLDRERRIWLYLPPGYDSTDARYPVMYMHDGQNLFDVLTSYAGEWEVDETLNTLSYQGYSVPIVVGIDNGGIHRTDELTPWPHPQYGGGQGDEYLAFIVETLKPYVDENYRTLTDRDNTAIMGSSLGGLISAYGALKYQEVFSKSGPFSPAYWINNDSIWEFASEAGMQDEIRFYQNAGEYEGDEYIDMMYQMADSLLSAGFENVSSKVIDGGQHNEQTWRDDFKEGYLYLFVSFANDVMERKGVKPLSIFPNPASTQIRIVNTEFRDMKSIVITDTSGKIVFKKKKLSTPVINVGNLAPGLYLINMTSPAGTFVGRFVKK